jgi:hypothetical protein
MRMVCYMELRRGRGVDSHSNREDNELLDPPPAIGLNSVCGDVTHIAFIGVMITIQMRLFKVVRSIGPKSYPYGHR